MASALAAQPAVIAKSHIRNGGAYLLVCRGARQGAAHHFGYDFWQLF